MPRHHPHQQYNPRHEHPCPYCQGRETIKYGTRKNRTGTIQIYRCSSCMRKFSHSPEQSITYPVHAIIETLSLYDRGYTLEESTRRAGKRHRLNLSKQLAGTWTTRYAEYFPYFRIRDTAG